MSRKFGIHVDFKDNTQLVIKKVKKAMEDAMTDIALDAKRVASMSAPHDTGYLEKNADYDIYVGNKYLEATIGFSAVERGFNYAQWTHDKKYNLGRKSARKSGGKSKFGQKTVPVGTGYLENTIKFNEQGYLDYIKEKYREAIK